MKSLAKGEKIFLIYSVTNVVLIWCAMENVGILNDDIALGIFFSWMLYLASCLFYGYVTMGE